MSFLRHTPHVVAAKSLPHISECMYCEIHLTKIIVDMCQLTSIFALVPRARIITTQTQHLHEMKTRVIKYKLLP